MAMSAAEILAQLPRLSRDELFSIAAQVLCGLNAVVVVAMFSPQTGSCRTRIHWYKR